MIDRFEANLIEPDKEPDRINFQFKAISGGNKEVLIVNNLAKSFQNKKIFENIDFLKISYYNIYK